MDSNCELKSAALCSGTCVCYNTCPMGYAYFPTRMDWSYDDGDDESTDELVYKMPCSGRGVCKSDGTCECVPGYGDDPDGVANC
jgi:hypothetical protein